MKIWILASFVFLGNFPFHAYRIKDQIDVHIFCGDTSEAEVDMLIEPADRLEKTPYGKEVPYITCLLQNISTYLSSNKIFANIFETPSW